VKHKTRSIPRAHKDSSSCSLHPVPVIGHRPVPNTASATTDRPNKWRRHLLHCTTFSARCANQRPNVLLSPPPGGEALWTGRDAGRSERASQAGGRTNSFHHNGQVYKQRRVESRRRPATMAFKVGHSSSQHFVTFCGSVLRCLTTFASSETQREELGGKYVAYARSGGIQAVLLNVKIFWDGLPRTTLLRCLEILSTAGPTTRSNIPEEFNHQQWPT